MLCIIHTKGEAWVRQRQWFPDISTADIHTISPLFLSRAPVQWCGIKIFIFLGVLCCVAKCSVYNSPMFHWSPGSGVTLIWCWYGSLFIFIVLRCCSYFYIDTAAARPSHYTEQHLSWMEHCRSLGTSFLLHIVHWNILLTTTQKAFILQYKDQKSYKYKMSNK